MEVIVPGSCHDLQLNLLFSMPESQGSLVTIPFGNRSDSNIVPRLRHMGVWGFRILRKVFSTYPKFQAPLWRSRSLRRPRRPKTNPKEKERKLDSKMAMQPKDSIWVDMQLVPQKFHSKQLEFSGMSVHRRTVALVTDPVRMKIDVNLATRRAPLGILTMLNHLGLVFQNCLTVLGFLNKLPRKLLIYFSALLKYPKVEQFLMASCKSLSWRKSL